MMRDIEDTMIARDQILTGQERVIVLKEIIEMVVEEVDVIIHLILIILPRALQVVEEVEAAAA